MVSIAIIKLLVPAIADENKSLVYWLTLTTKISDECKCVIIYALNMVSVIASSTK